jgi:hypothetical protein
MCALRTVATRFFYICSVTLQPEISFGELALADVSLFDCTLFIHTFLSNMPVLMKILNRSRQTHLQLDKDLRAFNSSDIINTNLNQLYITLKQASVPQPSTTFRLTLSGIPTEPHPSTAVWG